MTLETGQSEQDNYKQMVDCKIIEALEQGVASFDHLVMALPSVYPSTVLQSIQRLAADGKVAKKAADACNEDASQKPKWKPIEEWEAGLPVPHPLDYEWRFTQETSQRLLDRCLRLSRPNNTIALLGVPSLLRVSSRQHEQRLCLMDANVSSVNTSTNSVHSFQQFPVDITRQHLPDVEASVVVVDAPWYAEYIASFLWAAAQLCSINGYVLISLPPVGTRLGIKLEWANILKQAQEIGLSLVEIEPLCLAYMTPYFEQNALRAEGILNYPAHWRRGNLAIFTVQNKIVTPRPQVQADTHSWTEYAIEEVRIRLCNKETQDYQTPCLTSVLPGDVLPSVSRRDPRRQLAEVWTSGNRIFQCRGWGALGCVLEAMQMKIPPGEALSNALKRTLTQVEKDTLREVIAKIEHIVVKEREEMGLHGG